MLRASFSIEEAKTTPSGLSDSVPATLSAPRLIATTITRGAMARMYATALAGSALASSVMLAMPLRA